MKYLQRFSRAFAALTQQVPERRALRLARQQACMEADDWLGQLHLVARKLPPRNGDARRH